MKYTYPMRQVMIPSIALLLFGLSPVEAAKFQVFYDKDGRVIREIRDDMEVTYVYPANPSNSTDPKASKPTQRIERRRDGSVHDLRYDVQGLLMESLVIDLKGQQLRKWYNADGDIVRTIRPDGSEQTIDYFSRGVPKRIQTAGIVQDFHYDTSGILLERYKDGKLTWKRVEEPLSKVAYGVKFTLEGLVHSISTIENHRVLSDREVDALRPLIAEIMATQRTPSQP